MGGLARRATFQKQFLKDFAGSLIFQVDAGALFNPRAPNQARAQAMLEGIGKLGVEIVNLTPGDARELERLRAAGKLKLPQFVSANVFGPDRKAVAPPYVTRRAADGRRIVFLGLSSVPRHETFGYTVDDAQETLKRLLPQVRQEGDLVVVLAYMPNREVVNMGVNAKGVDVIVSAFEEQFGLAPYQFGDAWILQAQYEGRLVGYAGLQWTADKRLVKLDPQHIVALDASFADDLEMAAILARAKTPAVAASTGQ